MNVLIINDKINEKNGMGHHMRCRALHYAFSLNRAEVYRISFKNNYCYNYPEQHDLVVVDSYHACYKFYESIAVKTKLAIIDDCDRMSYPIENTIIIKDGIPFHKFPLTEGLTFIQTNILNPVFWKVPEKKINRKIKNVLINLGGTKKAKELTQIIAKSLKENYKLAIPQNRKSKDILKALLWADVALTGGGQSLKEALRVGTPAIVAQLFENQKKNIVDAVSNELVLIAEDLSMIKDFNKVEFSYKYSKANYYDKRKQIHRNCKKLIRGGSTMGVVNYLTNWVNKKDFA